MIEKCIKIIRRWVCFNIAAVLFVGCDFKEYDSSFESLLSDSVNYQGEFVELIGCLYRFEEFEGEFEVVLDDCGAAPSYPWFWVEFSSEGDRFNFDPGDRYIVSGRFRFAPIQYMDEDEAKLYFLEMASFSRITKD
ncbi:hypothetical protein [Saccharophagus degradans]|nr:hypothetical protein [Saccharophagus degradans]